MPNPRLKQLEERQKRESEHKKKLESLGNIAAQIFDIKTELLNLPDINDEDFALLSESGGKPEQKIVDQNLEAEIGLTPTLYGPETIRPGQDAKGCVYYKSRGGSGLNLPENTLIYHDKVQNCLYYSNGNNGFDKIDNGEASIEEFINKHLDPLEVDLFVQDNFYVKLVYSQDGEIINVKPFVEQKTTWIIHDHSVAINEVSNTEHFELNSLERSLDQANEDLELFQAIKEGENNRYKIKLDENDKLFKRKKEEIQRKIEFLEVQFTTKFEGAYIRNHVLKIENQLKGENYLKDIQFFEDRQYVFGYTIISEKPLELKPFIHKKEAYKKANDEGQERPVNIYNITTNLALLKRFERMLGPENIKQEQQDIRNDIYKTTQKLNSLSESINSIEREIYNINESLERTSSSEQEDDDLEKLGNLTEQLQYLERILNSQEQKQGKLFEDLELLSKEQIEFSDTKSQASIDHDQATNKTILDQFTDINKVTTFFAIATREFLKEYDKRHKKGLNLGGIKSDLTKPQARLYSAAQGRSTNANSRPVKKTKKDIKKRELKLKDQEVYSYVFPIGQARVQSKNRQSDTNDFVNPGRVVPLDIVMGWLKNSADQKTKDSIKSQCHNSNEDLEDLINEYYKTEAKSRDESYYVGSNGAIYKYDQNNNAFQPIDAKEMHEKVGNKKYETRLVASGDVNYDLKIKVDFKGREVQRQPAAPQNDNLARASVRHNQRPYPSSSPQGLSSRSLAGSESLESALLKEKEFPLQLGVLCQITKNRSSHGDSSFNFVIDIVEVPSDSYGKFIGMSKGDKITVSSSTDMTIAEVQEYFQKHKMFSEPNFTKSAYQRKVEIGTQGRTEHTPKKQVDGHNLNFNPDLNYNHENANSYIAGQDKHWFDPRKALLKSLEKEKSKQGGPNQRLIDGFEGELRGVLNANGGNYGRAM